MIRILDQFDSEIFSMDKLLIVRSMYVPGVGFPAQQTMMLNV